MANVVEQVVEEAATKFAVELADWVHEHVAAHPLSRDNRADAAPAAGGPA